MLLELTILTMAMTVIASIFIPTMLTGSSPVPTSTKVRRALLGILPKRLPHDPETSCVYELGSGWGGMAFALARTYPKHRIVGFEISLLPWVVSKIRLSISGQNNLSFKLGNFHTHDLSNATLVLCYLLPKPMEKLRIKLDQELQTGALVASNTFAFRDWRPVDEQAADDIYKSRVYLYEAQKG